MHNGDLSAPPELPDILRRRPWEAYWESNAGSKPEALVTFWIRWKRETGKDYLRPLPSASHPASSGFAGNRVPFASHRPPHQAEKNEQDARTG